MYIYGHEEILDIILDKYLTKYFDDKMSKYKHVNIRKLKKGLIYPDLPCGKYEIRQNQDVVMVKNKTCSMLKLYKVIGDVYRLKEIFQSHRGIDAFLHAMSYDPSLKVKDVIKVIMSNISAFALLSIYDKQYYDFPKNNVYPDPNIFWIGMILHIVTDSYSQSHTIRVREKETIYPKKDNMKEYVDFKMKLNKSFFIKISKETRITTKEELQQALIEHFKSRPHFKMFVANNLDDIFKSYKMHMFRQQTTSKIQKYFQVKSKLVSDTKDYDIINFQYYNNQDSIYHKKYDLMTKVKSNTDMYERMLSECALILLMYKQCIHDIVDHPDRHVIISRKFVTDLYEFLNDNTFRISKSNWNNKTGSVYS